VSLSRRALLRAGAVALGVESCHGALGPRRSSAGAVRAAPAPAGLSELELEDLVAFTGVLVEGRALSPDERRAVLDNIAERTGRGPEHLAVYRTTASLLRRLAGRRFASLSDAGRQQLVTRHRLDAADSGAGEGATVLAREVRLVRTRARRDLIADYYNSPAGWAVVGYGTFPGRCGDLLRYTLPER
jgi:hypothetical protein